ncbi:UDP-3-O-(3-hydroxymyristoyl)glucosamine N-acyltransferase [Candidatus Jidaibacter acanthamoebae]|nr:UDP-3-O-(3-hydroxymyristoyl)glucosamine N-acyltransferase [Candidatus Jidaibacter acanthamoeba]
MPDSRFFKNKGSFSVMEIAQRFNCEVIGDKNRIIKDIATLENAKEGDISFLYNPKYIEQIKTTKASACIIDEKNIPVAPPHLTLLVTDSSYVLYAKITSLFYGAANLIANISSTAVIAKSAKIGENVTIEDFAFVGENAEIGDNAYIGAHTYIGNGVKIGDNSTIHPQAYLTYCTIGSNCIIHSGVKIGQDGFGFAVGKEGAEKVLQLGSVIVGNNVEIGANTCIDRGTIEDTVIGDNTKIDNLVQLGHNVVIGKNCFVVAQVGIAGSTKIGDGVMIGGQAGIAGHLNIGDGAKIAAKSGVMQDVEREQMVGGAPAMNIRDWHRITAMLKKMIKGGGSKND